ncbi:MAG: bifunctional 4-hydroxy-2-oxoglutarate aldolase/2-dehydro-3-deoxy-phosphogluconate aldolase [Candidatus Omnitrophota bacterium]
MNIAEFKKLPIMGILRGIKKEAIKPLSKTIISAGLKTVEITMNTDNAAKLIADMKRNSDGNFAVGAGTVLTMEDLRLALDNGAEFIVMPVLRRDITEYCVKNNIPVFPGAFSPQEIYDAWCAGATMVKVFPAKFFGPAYFKEIKAPFNKIELLACGGVTANNIGDFFYSGASAAAFGASIFKYNWIKAENFVLIEEEIKKIIEAFNFSVKINRW